MPVRRYAYLARAFPPTVHVVERRVRYSRGPRITFCGLTLAYGWKSVRDPSTLGAEWLLCPQCDADAPADEVELDEDEDTRP